MGGGLHLVGRDVEGVYFVVDFLETLVAVGPVGEGIDVVGDAFESAGEGCHQDDFALVVYIAGIVDDSGGVGVAFIEVNFFALGDAHDEEVKAGAVFAVLAFGCFLLLGDIRFQLFLDFLRDIRLGVIPALQQREDAVEAELEELAPGVHSVGGKGGVQGFFEFFRLFGVAGELAAEGEGDGGGIEVLQAHLDGGCGVADFDEAGHSLVGEYINNTFCHAGIVSRTVIPVKIIPLGGAGEGGRRRRRRRRLPGSGGVSYTQYGMSAA